jgi:signal transduction histidine kinase
MRQHDVELSGELVPLQAEDVEEAPIIEPAFAMGTGEIKRIEEEPDVHGINDIPSPAFLVDDGWHVLAISGLAQQLCGYERDELTGQSLGMVVPAMDRLRGGEPLVRFVTGNQGMTVRHRCGREIPVDVFVGSHGEHATMVIARPLEGGGHTVPEEDIAEIVHDLKTPLATIALEADVLANQLELGARVDAQAAALRIVRNATFLDRMVQDLLDLCSLDAGQLVLYRVATDVSELVTAVTDRVVPTRDRLRVSVDARCHEVLEIDALRIERVLANFLHNALKYAPRTSHIDVRIEVEHDIVRVSVSDSGPGLTPSEMRYVFDKFRRAPSSSSHHGCGLGLYVSKRIVEAHGGRIGVESVTGQGSCFYFELPRR